MLALALLALHSFSPADASTAWNPVCTSAADPSVWFVFTSTDPKATPNPDYDCLGLFYDTTTCLSTLGLGKIKQTGTDSSGYSTFELRYLPAGDLVTIVTFLNQPGGGVLYKTPTVVASSPAAAVAPPQPEDLVSMYLQQRNKASAATSGVAMHLWTCPDLPIDVPNELLTPTGLQLILHTGKVSTF